MNHDEKTLPEIINDEPVLKDSAPPSKLPWLIAAGVIVLLVTLAQWGVGHFFSPRTKAGNTEVAAPAENSEENRLPMPRPTSKAVVKTELRPEEDVTAYLKSKEVNPSDELARLKLLARVQAQKELLKNDERMRLSPALLPIGVSTPKNKEKQGNTGQGYSENPNTAYLERVSAKPMEEVEASRFGDLRYRIRRGKILRGVTESAIDSDLPGLIRGHLTEDVYGDAGDLVLLPNGAGLVGEYRSGSIAEGQVSLYVVWTRVQLPNGIVVTLDSAGSDPLGRAGMTGPVDHHYLQRFGSSLLSSFFSVSVATLGVNGQDRYNSAAAYRTGLANAFGQTASQEFQQNATIQNTIRPPQGTEISILVNKDLSFEQVLTTTEARQ